jgi:large subunit ribosomal protein L33
MQEIVTIECTEARKEGKPPSRYLTRRNKKTVTERIEKKKYNPHLRRHTMHKEIKCRVSRPSRPPTGPLAALHTDSRRESVLFSARWVDGRAG